MRRKVEPRSKEALTEGRDPAAMHPVLSSHGYSPLYRDGEVNRCPGCGQCQWIIGRITAECAFCATALPLRHTGFEGMGIGPIYWERDVYRHGWHCGPQHPSLAYEAAEWAP